MRNYQTIVVGIDFSEASGRALTLATKVADRFSARRLHLVHVVSYPASVLPSLSLSNDVTAGAVAEAEARLQALPLPEVSGRVTREVRSGAPAQELAQAADAAGADLIVVAGRGHGVLAELVLGSVSSSLIRVAHCPILVDSGVDEREDFREIVAAIDLSPISRHVLEGAFGVAQRFGAKVKVLSLFEHPLLKSGPNNILPKALSHEDIDQLGEEHRREVDRLLARVRTQGVPTEVEVMSKAPAANVIVDVAKMIDADLVVLGTSGQGAWHRMILGSTANFVLSRSPCPVLVVPHEVTEDAVERSTSAVPA